MSEVRLFAITLKTLVEADPFHMLYPFSGVDFPSQTPAFSGGLARTVWPQEGFRRWSSSQMSTFWENNVCATQSEKKSELLLDFLPQKIFHRQTREQD